jgi:DMSO/TMAO reductase YedYZ molybdopterin-dependent catalytic subunit
MKKKAYSLLALCLIIWFAAGCGVSVQADLSTYGDQPILISGLSAEDFTVTPNELAQLDCESQSATGKTQKAGTVHGVGPTLDTFLAQYNKKQTDFQKIIFRAKDGYTITLGPQDFKKHTIILSLANGKEPLSEQEAPLRLLIPGAESGKWVRMVTEIKFVAM